MFFIIGNLQTRLILNVTKECKSGIYQGMILSGKLKEHLLMVQEQAELQFDVLVEQMAEREGVMEQLKEESDRCRECRLLLWREESCQYGI